MYGPDDHFDIERSHALGAIIKKVYDAKKNNLNKVQIWGTGKPIREWLYVEDGAEALIKCINLGSIRFLRFLLVYSIFTTRLLNLNLL